MLWEWQFKGSASEGTEQPQLHPWALKDPGMERAVLPAQPWPPSQACHCLPPAGRRSPYFPHRFLCQLCLGTKAVNRTLLGWQGWDWPFAAAPLVSDFMHGKINWAFPHGSLAKSVICQVQIPWHLQVQTLSFGLIWKSRSRNNRQTLLNWSHDWGLGGRSRISQTTTVQNNVPSWTAQEIWQRSAWINASLHLYVALRQKKTCTQTDRQTERQQ